MKVYNDPNGFRIVGKAWEIRHRLRKLSNRRKTLSDYVRSARGRAESK
jgi:hypothetical protein